MNNRLERVRVMNEISTFTDRAADCIKNGLYMIGDYNARQVRENFFEYYIYKSKNVKLFIGTLAELKKKLA